MESMGRDAIFDILLSERFQGAMDKITFITEFIDQYFAIFISVVSFFIISAALLRNVIAGAYAAFPKFWDKVADAKVAMQGRTMNLGGTDVTFLMKLLAFFIPDLKSLSDFHDNTIEPKHYFIVAIPQMFAVVMIGVMIYNGYYRDVTAVTAQFGSAVIEKVLFNVHPVEIIDKAIASAFTPTMASKIDNTETGEYVNKIATAAYKEVMAVYFDITDKGTKTRIASDIEARVYNFVTTNAKYLNSEGYKISFQVEKALGTQVGAINNMMKGNNEEYTALGFEIPFQELKSGSQAKDKDVEWYVRIVTTHEKVASKTEYVGELHDLVLTVKPGPQGQSKLEVSSRFTGTNLKIGGKEYTIENGTRQPRSAGVDFGSNNASYPVEGQLSYKTSDGKTHYVKNIKVSSALTTPRQLQSASRPAMKITDLNTDFPKGTE